jgi:hypothetical protein
MANKNIKLQPSKLYEFEGEQLTVAQVHARVPRLGISTVRTHLKAGRKTRFEMLADPRAVRRQTRHARQEFQIRRRP